MRTPKRPRRRVRLPAALSLAGMAILAVLVGYVLGQVLLNAVLGRAEEEVPAQAPSGEPAQTPATPSTPTTARVDVMLPSFALYRVQLGAFSNRDNAQNLAADAQARGFPAYVTPGPLYRVVVGYFSSKAASEPLVSRLEKQGYEVYVGATELASGVISLQGDKEYLQALKSVVEGLSAFVRDQAAWWDAYWSHGSGLTEGARKLVEDARGINQEILSVTASAGWTGTQEELASLAQLAVQVAVEIEALAAQRSTQHLVMGGSAFVELVEKLNAFCMSLAEH